jgi:hypothetical protein
MMELAGQSGFASENLTTLAHFSVSAIKCVPNSAEVKSIGVAPSSASLDFIFGSLEHFPITLTPSCAGLSGASTSFSSRRKAWMADKRGHDVSAIQSFNYSSGRASRDADSKCLPHSPLRRVLR